MTVSGLLIWRSDAAQYGLTLAIVLGTAGAVLGRSAILSAAGVVLGAVVGAAALVPENRAHWLVQDQRPALCPDRPVMGSLRVVLGL
ncbi:hypothetical protein AD951_04780 [Acetobacter malorum]|uniref:Uncharacterized protein n=1 Tax=Acetobacter malorum TaxID=178901 RepID=A0A149UPN9_9PROT|nr:hypothetical protein [Acetobacter malorum]KXV69858.1 hypothetical protein AD951_04780 [Acetobacter malorum]